MTVSFRISLPVLFVVTALGLTVGCDGGGGGAAVVPSITYIPSAADSSGDQQQPTGPAIEGSGTLTGRIRFDGPAPNEKILVQLKSLTKDKGGDVCAATAAITDDSLVVGDDGGVANVFIYIDKPPAGAVIPDPPSEPVLFDQKGCVFTPHALVVQTNQTVLIKSADALAHNTNAKPKRSAGFNQVIQANDRNGTDLIYTKPEREPVSVRCDFHTWMKAFHLVLSHPWGTATKPDGTFEIKDLPASNLTLRIWHERAGGTGGFLQRSLKVTIKDGETTDLGDLNFKPPAFGLGL